MDEFANLAIWENQVGMVASWKQWVSYVSIDYCFLICARHFNLEQGCSRRFAVKKGLCALALTCCLMAGNTSAIAATANGVLTVQATVVAACAVGSGTLVFGTIDPALGTSGPANANVNVTCTQGTPFSIGLSDGSNASGTQRRMKGASQSQFLAYELHRDSAGLQRFGDSVTSQRLTGQTGLGAIANTIAIYASIAAGQSAPADTYSDTVPITVYY
ncbi:Csu type fimbrial protein [Sphingomonas aerolata]|uniref:Csu type fimbrial protein n=1 Tax=Sphingomonas aerolata TaxID=185951 RepID=UPI00335DF049